MARDRQAERPSGHRRYRSRGLGWGFTVLGTAICLPGLIGFHSFWNLAPVLFRNSPGTLVGYVSLLVGSALIGGKCLHIGRRLRAGAATLGGSSVPTDSILYLRPFCADGPDAVEYSLDAVAQLWPRTEEEILVSALARLAPVRAIGRPEERLVTLGAEREYVEDAEWQRLVYARMGAARLVVIRSGESAGIWWEIQTAFESLPASRILLQIPARKWWFERARDDAAWRREFRERVHIELPVGASRATFIWFDEERRPILLHDRRGFLVYPRFVRALLPIYASWGIPLPERWLIAKSALLWTMAACLLVAAPFAIFDLVRQWFA